MERLKSFSKRLWCGIILLAFLFPSCLCYGAQSTYFDVGIVEITTKETGSSNTDEATSKNNEKIQINGVWYDSFADFYVASGFSYIEKNDLVNELKYQYEHGGTVNKSYFYVDDSGENLVPLLINNSGLYTSFASIAYKYIVRTTAGKATIGGYQVMCFETDTSTQMYLTDAERTAVDQKAAAILSSARGSSNVETVKNVFSWFKNNVSYDYSGAKGNAYDALIGNNCVCAGYASAFQYIMEKAGIPCVIVTGLTSSGVGHAWNAVYVNSSWYYVDCTYGAGYNSDSWLLFGTNMIADIYSIGISSTSYDKSSAGRAADVTEAENKYYGGQTGGVTVSSSIATIVVGSDTSQSDNASNENVAGDESLIETTTEDTANLAYKEELIEDKLTLKESLLDSSLEAEVAADNAITTSTVANKKISNEKTARFNKSALFSVLTGFGIVIFAALILGIKYLIVNRKTIKKNIIRRKLARRQ